MNSPTTPLSAHASCLPLVQSQLVPSLSGNRILKRAGAQWPLWWAGILLGGAQFLAIIGWWMASAPNYGAALLIFLWMAGLSSLSLAGWRLYRRVLQPLQRLENQVEQIHQDAFGSPLGANQTGALGALAEGIEELSRELSELYEDMDSRVAHQTRRLAQKTASLKILYEAAASINKAHDLSPLLSHYLRTFKGMVNGRAATVYLTTPEGALRIVGSIGTDNQLLSEHELLPLPLCRCGCVLVPGEILCERDAQACSVQNGRPMYGPDAIEIIEVPMYYHNECLGFYRIYVDRPGIGGREDVLDLLTTISSHLAMAIAKQRSDMEARRLFVIEERNHLAHELHDSLAQTLASLRFQVRMLQETMTKTGETVLPNALLETQRIRAALDEAHGELRELLNNFRVPSNQGGLAAALERLVARFRQKNALSIFFQQDCRPVQLSTHEEMQMLRIVQEALTNIRKHAQARTVRVLLRCHGPGAYLLLVEDDGVGFERPLDGSGSGEHIGLSIMEERARRIGATLRIESEPGEGTRVEMLFRPGRRPNAALERGTC